MFNYNTCSVVIAVVTEDKLSHHRGPMKQPLWFSINLTGAHGHIQHFYNNAHIHKSIL